ncbi:MAG: thymidylate synthase [bacterium]|nr:thymidylate synthase [bacterium]
MNAINTQYRDLLKKVLDEGVTVPSQQGVDAKMIMGAPPMRFRLSEGFPVITERDLSKFWRAPIGEIFAFINGARTQEELETYGCKWWKAWVTPEKCAKRGLDTGDLGPGSYGAAFHDFPTSEGESFNQFKYLIKQIKEQPQLRTHFVTPWIPQYIYRVDGRQQKVVVCPCHGWMHFRVVENKLFLHMFQRSGDLPVGVPSNLIQYSALLLAVAHVTGLEPYEYVHTISDAHIYLDQLDSVEEMLTREPRPLPTMKLVDPPNDIFSFRKENFELVDYNPHPAIKKIPAAI